MRTAESFTGRLNPGQPENGDASEKRLVAQWAFARSMDGNEASTYCHMFNENQ